MRDKEKYRAYMRSYMQKRRGSESVKAPSSCVSPAVHPLVPVPVLDGGIGRVEPLDAPPVLDVPSVVLDIKPVVVDGRELKVNGAMARFLATAQPAAVGVDSPDEPMTRARWRKMSPEARARYVKHSTELDSDEAVAEWLEGLPG